MVSFKEYTQYDGLGLAELIRKKEVAPQEVVEAALEQVNTKNKQINALIFTQGGRAVQDARNLTDGPFCGVYVSGTHP